LRGGGNGISLLKVKESSKKTNIDENDFEEIIKSVDNSVEDDDDEIYENMFFICFSAFLKLLFY
jgi:hypothetical protein